MKKPIENPEIKSTAPEKVVNLTPPAGSVPEAGDEKPKNELKKKAFLEKAVEQSGVKKKDAKPAIEAALAILSEALLEGKDINLPPLGKLKLKRRKDLPNSKVLVLKLRIPDQMGVATPDAVDTLN